MASLIFIFHFLISEFAETERAKEEVGAASSKKGKDSLKKKISWLKLISAKVSNVMHCLVLIEELYLLILLCHWYGNNPLFTRFIVSKLTRFCLQCSNDNGFIPLVS